MTMLCAEPMYPKTYSGLVCTHAEHAAIPQWYAKGRNAYHYGYERIPAHMLNIVYRTAWINGWDDASREAKLDSDTSWD